MSTLAPLRAGELRGIRRLDLSCGLTEFPPEIFQLADSLEILNLSGNALRTLPDDLHRLHRLRVVFCSDNRFTELPASLGRCAELTTIGFKANAIEHVPAQALPPKLRWLILTDNRISKLPDALGACTALQKLMLAGNRLTALPPSMAGCRKLELVRIAANRFTELPRWLLTLPRLAWLAYAGNPFCDEPAARDGEANSTTDIEWPRLQLQGLLGEGASGVIHQALWTRDSGEPRPVAVKLFKADMTSDGLPRSEVAACLAAGTHSNLIAVEGVITGHPNGAAGMAMRLIDPAFRNLAGPPSLDSCTRDVYAAEVRFTLAAVLSMAGGIASAASHLHARHIVHGDLYAHNTLVTPDGRTLLGDFGAASFMPADSPEVAEALKRLEVRAFGCLLEELLDRCDADEPADAIATLKALHERCVSEDIAARPSFAQIEHLLKELAGTPVTA